MIKFLFYCSLFTVILAGCQMGKQHEDINNQSHDSDLSKIPLKGGYEIISADKGASFSFKLPFGKMDDLEQIMPIDSVNTIGSVFILYSSMIYVNYENTSAWFIIDTENKTQKVYTRRSDYINALKAMKISEVKLYDIYNLFSSYDTTGKLPKDWD